MLRSVFIIICLLIANAMLSQQIITKDFESEFLESSRSISIFIPESYDLDSIKNYPLTIVLHRSLLFDTFAGNSKLFAQKDLAPEQIIVGIDMDATFVNDISFNRNNGQLSKSAESFYNFISNELLFYMESEYRTSPFVSIVGQGYAANLITHFLKGDNGIINSLICINPSFSEFIGQQLASYDLGKYKKYDSTYYFYSNNSSTFSTNKSVFLTEIQQALTSLDIENFNIINDNISTKNSTSAISEAIPRALSSIFELYAPISKEEYNASIKDLDPLDAIAYLEDKYVEIEYLFGSKLGIRERDIYAIENIIIDKKNGDYLKEFGKMILKIYPTSHLGNYYLGKYYELGNNIKKALYEYKVGYGKMDPSDPNADAFYENILRIGGQ